ncbi:GerA spore germination protein [Paenibacillus alvei DSM 29]|nr:GerA spore germination protein [Paenibacillus alvei DSM 29]
MTRITQRFLNSFLKKRAKREIVLQEDACLLNQQFTFDLQQNEQMMNELFRNCSDVVYRSVQLHGQMQALLIYVDGMIDSVSLEETILKPLINPGLPNELSKLECLGELIANQAVATRQIKLTDRVSETVQDILSGHVAVFAAGEHQVLLADLTNFEKRQVTEP